MNIRPTLLATDILSAIMRREPQVTARARAYLLEHRHFAFSVITRYEVMRGLLAMGAVRQQQAFEQLCAVSTVLPFTDEAARQAAAIYADLHTRGALLGDADSLLAATALVNGLAVATNNEVHFARIAFVTIVNWPARTDL